MNTTQTPAQTAVTNHYEGKVWFYKERDDYGRTVRRVTAMKNGERLNLGVIVCVPRWKEELREQYGMERYFTNDFIKGDEARKAGRMGEKEFITQHRTLKLALAQFGLGSVEGERYSYNG
ncbi:hypothetical protein SEA_SHROOMS_11 [Arthrobacter phage Shrooms]|nr:hypothetical protein SEA_SHROOMS_11 [Arthrobacter phage Shrooms]